MALVLYLATSALLLAAARLARFTVSRREALFLIALPALLTGRAMLTGRLVAPVDFPYLWEPFAGYRAELGVTSIETLRWSDVASQLVPWREAVRDALTRGEWPLLNRYELSGSPLAASAQSAAFHPFTLIASLVPAVESFNFTASIALFVAAFGAFVFSRELGLSPLASSFAAGGWMLSSPLAFFALWPIGAAWAHLPLLLAATRRIVRDPGRRTVFTLAVILSLVILSGHPETLLHLVGIGVAYGIFEVVRSEQRVRSLMAAVAAGVLALMLGAIYLLPLVEALPQTHEHWIREALYAKT
ncbi:MAG TPA: hypothetical protein VFL80_09880, partial [Thermoanaerobaculia bacterium]|nr:hypothetical protein [Thermoanaerobaculia bacterium]